MITVMGPNKGTPDDPIPVPVLKSHADQSDAYKLKVQLRSSYGAPDKKLFKVFTRSNGIFVGPTTYAEISGGVEATILVYLTPDTVGAPDTVEVIASKYGLFVGEKPVAGKRLGQVVLHFAPQEVGEEEEKSEVDLIVDEVVSKAVPIVVGMLTNEE